MPTTKAVLASNDNLPKRAEWGARAAWEATRLLEGSGLDAEIVDWGVDRGGDVLWLNIDSGDFNMDLAISREFHEFFGFRDRKDQFLSHVRRVHPAFFSQNGVGRHVHGLDLEDPEGVEVVYEGDRSIPDFTEQLQAEEAENERRKKQWEDDEKGRKERAKNAAAAAKK
jgi:hypothetical protein